MCDQKVGQDPSTAVATCFYARDTVLDAGEHAGGIKKVCGTDLSNEFRSQSQFVVRSNKYCSLEGTLYDSTIIFILCADHLNKF